MKDEEQISSEELLRFITECDLHDEEFMKQTLEELFKNLTSIELEKAS